MGRYILFLLCLVIISGTRASADPQDIATTNAPVIWARIQQGNVTVRTWDRPEVQIDADPGIDVHHIPVEKLADKSLPPNLFRFWQQNIQTPDGEQLQLAAEPFPVAPLDAQPHDGIRIVGDGNVTLTIPANSPLVVTNVQQGQVTVDGYHNGTIVSHIVVGGLHLNNVSGTVGAQVNNGQIVAQNSQFDRIRARNGRGGMFFENCSSRQIEATSLLGKIVYDRGSFDPGLARFESQRGDIALGVARGGAQVDAHSGTGHVYTDGAVHGGPVVTATSARGNVMYYSGSVRDHANLQQPRTPHAPTNPRRRFRPRPIPTFKP